MSPLQFKKYITNITLIIVMEIIDNILFEWKKNI